MKEYYVCGITGNVSEDVAKSMIKDFEHHKDRITYTTDGGCVSIDWSKVDAFYINDSEEEMNHIGFEVNKHDKL